MKSDIKGLEDIKILVDEFYGKVKEDALLAPIFFEHIPGDWGPHLNKMYKFWNAALFGKTGYVGNPFARHAHMPVMQTHFEHWLHWWWQTVDNHFEGPIANDAKKRGEIMANTFLNRIIDLQNSSSHTIA
ncbi:MAG: group III truncated hemoglobin [Chitinophagaceae bacterium]